MLSDRLKVAIPLIAVTLLAFFLPGVAGKIAFAILAVCILGTANHEGAALAGLERFGAQEWLLHGYAAALIANAWAKLLPDEALLMAFLLGAFATAFGKAVSRESLDRVAGTVLVGVMVCWTLSFLAKIFYCGAGNAPLLLAYLVAITKVADIGAYAAGSLTAKLPGGNHKLSPHVSPKKSWEGLLGGCVVSVGVSLLFLKFAPSLSLTWCSAILLGILAATLGLLGDLSESLLKRAAGTKDSGKIPGLGGALDVVDSLLPMGVVIYVFMSLSGKGL